jgi:PAS domain S-box-containing protein
MLISWRLPQIASKIGRRLMILIIAFSSLLTFFITAIQLFADYRQQRADLEDMLNEVQVFLPSIAASVWTFNDRQIKLALDALINLPNVERAKITASSGDMSWSAERGKSQHTVARQYPLRHEVRGAEQQIASIEVTASLDSVYDRVLSRAITVLLSNGLKTFLVAIFMFIVFRKLVTSRLERLADNVHGLIPRLMLAETRVSTSVEQKPTEGDEIDALQWTFDSMANQLKSAVTDLQRTYEELRKEHDLTRMAIDSVPGIFHLFDASGRLLLWNRNFEQVTGYNAEEIAAMNPPDFFIKADREMATERFALAFDEGAANFEAALQPRIGPAIPYYFTGSRCEFGGVPCVIGVGLDISTRKAMEEQLRRSNADLQQFAYVASHDLQEPLRMIKSYLQLIERRMGDALTGEVKEYFAYPIEGVDRLQNLILDLLAYSQVGKGTQSFVRFPLERVIDRIEEKLAPVISSTGAIIHRHNLPTILGDEHEVLSLMRNLIENAIKYRKPDVPPEVDISAERDNGHWVISIRDNGMGIDKEYWERIFVIFQRLHTREAYQGTGIGLALCKKIVERHGGRIWVESAAGQGSTFFFTLTAAE